MIHFVQNILKGFELSFPSRAEFCENRKFLEKKSWKISSLRTGPLSSWNCSASWSTRISSLHVDTISPFPHWYWWTSNGPHITFHQIPNLSCYQLDGKIPLKENCTQNQNWAYYVCYLKLFRKTKNDFPEAMSEKFKNDIKILVDLQVLDQNMQNIVLITKERLGILPVDDILGVRQSWVSLGIETQGWNKTVWLSNPSMDDFMLPWSCLILRINPVFSFSGNMLQGYNVLYHFSKNAQFQFGVQFHLKDPLRCQMFPHSKLFGHNFIYKYFRWKHYSH